MRIIEENRLKTIVNIINEYQIKSENISSFYNNINKIKVESLQELFTEKNNEFFDDVSFVLDAITSIIAKPHISNKTEDIILRSDVAGHISNEAFQMSYKEPSLWKEKDFEMVPEYVHHYQYTDEIKIYENIFIGMLIDLIDIELNTFLDMYEGLIPSLDSNTIVLKEDKNIEELIKYANKLERRVRYIKGTHFYKEVSKVSLKGHVITPTNILTKDRLYNYCFKFYKKFIQYTDYNSILQDLKKYYLTLILINFKSKKFALDEKISDFDDLYFNINDYKININAKNDYIKYTVEYKNTKSITNLYIDTNEDKQYNEECDYKLLIKLYNIKNLDTNEYVFHNPKLEKELIDYLISESIKTYTGKKELYTTYCPICRGKDIENIKNLYRCNSCESEYLFIDKNTIWFKKIRRL